MDVSRSSRSICTLINFLIFLSYLFYAGHILRRSDSVQPYARVVFPRACTAASNMNTILTSFLKTGRVTPLRNLIVQVAVLSSRRDPLQFVFAPTGGVYLNLCCPFRFPYVSLSLTLCPSHIPGHCATKFFLFPREINASVCVHCRLLTGSSKRVRQFQQREIFLVSSSLFSLCARSDGYAVG